MPSRLKVLVACEFSAIVREAFNRMGHEAWSCDLLPSEIPGRHFQGDALEMLTADDWDLVIAHPPCTYLCNSGVRWLYGGKGQTRDETRWRAMQDGARFFRSFFELYKGPALGVENPIMHSHGLAEVGSPAGVVKQTVQPWQHGHLETKATILWLRGLQPLHETANVKAAMLKLPKSQTNKVHLASPGPDRWAMRSRTFPGIAEAMAQQWGGRVTHKSFPVVMPAAISRSRANPPAPLPLGTL